MTIEKSYISGRDVRPLQFNEVAAYEDLSRLGLGFDAQDVRKMVEMYAMDSVQAGVTTASITTPVQFLQEWLPGFVEVMTAARKIDEAVGIMTAGEWHHEQVVQGVLENTGTAQPYSDYSNVNFASWNVNFVTRTVVRFEQGMRVGRLEEARAATIRMNSAQTKRESAGKNLEIQRNLIGFNGFNSGANLTYGLLNDPSLPAYQTVAATGTGSSTQWANKTFLNITQDILTAIVALRTQSQDQIDPENTDLTLVLPTDARDLIATLNTLGSQSVAGWLAQVYPRIRVVSMPQFNYANGGSNVFYLFADNVRDLSTDDGRTFVQIVPTKFKVLGVAQQAKGFEEDYTNATAGVMCKRPFAVYRASGI